ncbi:hypothetical protein [Halobacterium yunchengense]|uniref:hypothetical protein n=1 Tax=Halobacterium yunchengense TaxID=3108497 RepID=UPI00300B36E8
MASLRSLLARERVNAFGAWVVVAALAVAGSQFLRASEPDWTALTLVLVAAAVLVPLVERDPSVTVPGELLALVAVPVVVRAFGVLPSVTPFFAIAGVALLVAVLLDAYTSLSMTPRFAVVFVVVVTMAFAGAWAVGTYAADVVVGTSFVPGQQELMWDLVGATAAGVAAGVVFDVYFEYSDRVSRLRRATRDDAASAAAGGELPGDGRQHVLAVRAMQAVLVAATALAVLELNATLAVNTAVPLAITLLPAALRREYEYTMDTGLVVWVTAASTLHALGAVGLYEWFGWYDSVTHALSASLVAGVGYAVARAVERHSRAVAFNRGFRATFVVLFVLAVGVGWELLEFASGGLASAVGGEPVLAQYSTADIVNDLVFNAVGAVVVAAGSSAHFEDVAALATDWVGVAVRSGE